MAVSTGSRLGPYEIVSALGAGGMGEVYRARDTRLGRDVAVKVLRAEVAVVPERVRRFEKEARTVASLSHPNILALYDVGTHEGAPYLVTELLEGQALAERIRSGDLTVTKAVELGTQIAHGLAAAHEHGIVHRDLKPGNVFVTKDGVVKILDFGLARLRSVEVGSADDSTAAATTAAGVVLGTAAYMSPEQARGLPADHRSDIFSFGCVLYEMLAGERAFRGDSATDVAAAILKDDPAPLPTRVPPALEKIITRCLEKRPENRFHSAHDLVLVLQAVGVASPRGPLGETAAWLQRRKAIAAIGAVFVVVGSAGGLWLLRRPAPAPQSAGPTRIVVFPFENLGAPEDAYFASGMAEEITSRLANVRALAVISRTTAMSYDRKGKTIKEIGEDLRVDYVLEGSVRWEHGEGRESRVRISPQLIRVADDTHVWSERYDRVLTDVFAMQSEVARNAVRAMGVMLLPREQTALRDVSTNDLEAYDLYLRARELQASGEDREHVEGALHLFQKAVDRDPQFALALGGLAVSQLYMRWLEWDRDDEKLARAKEAVERAVELRPDLAETHVAFGWYFYQGLLDYPRALEEFDTARRIQPSNAAAWWGTGVVLRRQGRWVQAVDVIAKALALDPKRAQLNYSYGETCALAQQYAAAQRGYEMAIALNPQYGDAFACQAWLQIQWRGDSDKAVAILQEAGRVAGIRDDSMFLADTATRLSLIRRDLQGLRGLLGGDPPPAVRTQFCYMPLSLTRGQIAWLLGQHDLARRSFEAARQELEQKVAEDPGDARFHSSLGIAYAGLGRHDDAVREARLGCDLMPTSKDAWRALFRLEDLALVCTMVGDQEEAIARLDDLLAARGWFSAHTVRLDPRFDPLRDDPRFQALLTKYEVKE